MNVTEFRRRGDAIADHVSKWHHHPEAMCHMLRFRKMEDFNEFSASLEKGGTGSKKKVKGGSTFVANDYGHSMRLKGRGENILHLNYEPYGDDKVKFYSFGKLKAESDVVKLADQMSMIQHIKGEASYLSDKQRRCRREG